MKTIGVTFLLLLAGLSTPAQTKPLAPPSEVVWHGLGTNENDSMPLGNGDLALNVWTETNGDLLLLIAKADAWSENGQLLKLGRVRVKLANNPFINAPDFTQCLQLESGEVTLQAGNNRVVVWVDANRPVAHVEIQTELPVELEARAELWRTNSYHLDQRAVAAAGIFEWGNNPDGLTFEPDIVFHATNPWVAWAHYNTRSIYPLVFEQEHLASLLPKYPDPLLHRCFGIAMKGSNLAATNQRTVKSTQAGKTFRLDLYALTDQVDSPDRWLAETDQLMAKCESVSIATARQAHRQWWSNFWNRSWIRVSGDPGAEAVSQGYAIQRFMTACAGRGAQPIKFNGSLFTVGHDLPAGTSSTENNHDPDYRAWGACYWNQNVRFSYWPLLASDDYDLLQPWFDMYLKALPLAKDRTRAYFHHDGASFIETMYFWGLPNVNDFGWNNPGPELQSEWMRYHIQGGLEVLAQMLDRYDYAPDDAFARNRLLPFADAILTYYDQHWPRGADGKIHMAPAQAIETYQRDAVNPAPDLAGLISILPRLLQLPQTLSTAEERGLWNNMLKDVPPLPTGTTAHGKIPPQGHGETDGKPVLLPAYQYGEPRNHENPELYAVFPYPIYGVGKPELQLARNTFAARLHPFGKCWGQDGIQAAMLGLTGEAKKSLLQEFTSYGNQRFKWFWSKNSDWIPDMDNGGAGMLTLQRMIMQCDGKRILLLPAWPEAWNADFKLHAPYNTIVSGKVVAGKIIGLEVLPAERAKDVVMPGSTPPVLPSRKQLQ